MKRTVLFISGMLIIVVLAALAKWFGSFGVLPSAVVALILGASSQPFWQRFDQLSLGLQWSEKSGLGLAIALLGLQMPLLHLLDGGGRLILLVILGLLFTLALAWVLAKAMKLSRNQGILMAIGNGICGSAAVMATQSVIKSNREDTVMAVSLVNVLGLLGILLTPWLVVIFFPNQAEAAGHWLGNTLQSMPHVVAAAMSSGDGVVEPAVWVKMLRILMLVPVLMVLASWHAKTERSSDQSLSWWALIPVFVWGFLICVVLASLAWIPTEWLPYFESASKWLMTMALVAMGAQIQWRSLRQNGLKMLLLGVLLFAGQLLFSAWLIHQL